MRHALRSVPRRQQQLQVFVASCLIGQRRRSLRLLACSAWSEVVAVLERAEMFWISTVRADGRPHVTPLPAMWLDGALHFSTGLDEQKGRNLLRNPNCILITGDKSYWQCLDVVVEGRAERVTDRPTLERRRFCRLDAANASLKPATDSEHALLRCGGGGTLHVRSQSILRVGGRYEA
jgi:hypothetical protein